jgi:hypothetical protein
VGLVLVILAALRASSYLVEIPIQAAVSGNAHVTINLKAIDALLVSNAGSIQLQATAGSNILSAPSDNTARLNYSHNSPYPKKITTQVLPFNNPGGHDITLNISAVGGAGQKTIILAGVPQNAQEIYRSISAGSLNNCMLTYSATCTASGTRVSASTSFNILVTFTTTD